MCSASQKIQLHAIAKEYRIITGVPVSAAFILRLAFAEMLPVFRDDLRKAKAGVFHAKIRKLNTAAL